VLLVRVELEARAGVGRLLAAVLRGGRREARRGGLDAQGVAILGRVLDDEERLLAELQLVQATLDHLRDA